MKWRARNSVFRPPPKKLHTALARHQQSDPFAGGRRECTYLRTRRQAPDRADVTGQGGAGDSGAHFARHGEHQAGGRGVFQRNHRCIFHCHHPGTFDTACHSNSSPCLLLPAGVLKPSGVPRYREYHGTGSCNATYPFETPLLTDVIC